MEALSDPNHRSPLLNLESVREMASLGRLENGSELNMRGATSNPKYSVQVYSIVGSHVGGFSLPSAVLGIKGMTWSPNGRYLALVGYDGVARVIESEHWHVIATLRGFETSLVIKPDGDARDRMVRCEFSLFPVVLRFLTRSLCDDDVSTLRG